MRLTTCIHQFFDTYLPNIKGVSRHTIKTYRDTFKLLLPFAAGFHKIQIDSLSLSHLNPEMILAFLDYLESERSNSAKTRNNRLAAIKSLAKMIRFMYPDKREVIEKVVQIPQKRTQRQLIGFLYPEEFYKTLHAVDLKKSLGFRDYTILQLLFESGARASEISGLKLDYFNPKFKTLAILGKGNRFRQIELSPLVIRLIKTYIAQYRKSPKRQYLNRLFISQHGRALTRHGIYRLCQKYMCKALPPKRIKMLNMVHSFRHGCAVAMLASGCSVAEIRNHLGHEDIQSSMVYLQLDINRRRMIQKKFTEYTQSILSQNAEIEALIDKKEKDDIMDWLDDL
ncbi:tyrosine-type recombinase/integrase [Desulfobacterales bacterium HSG17]|nr:tyrosine-type recombinase/integrase [Desulfobacterales bacterium HSG17]